MDREELKKLVENGEILLPILVEYKNSKYHEGLYYKVVMTIRNVETLTKNEHFNLVSPFVFQDNFLKENKNLLKIMTHMFGEPYAHATVCRYESEISNQSYNGAKLAKEEFLVLIYSNLMKCEHLRHQDIDFLHNKIIFDEDICKWEYVGERKERIIFINDSNDCLQIQKCNLTRFFHFENKYSFNEKVMAKVKYDRLIRDAEFIKELYKFEG